MYIPLRIVAFLVEVFLKGFGEADFVVGDKVIEMLSCLGNLLFRASSLFWLFWLGDLLSLAFGGGLRRGGLSHNMW